MNKKQIRQLVRQELESFKKEQAKVDAAQKERIQKLAGMKKKMSADACKAQGMMTMADFLQLMNRIKSAEKGQLYKKNEDRLLDEDDEEQSLDLRGVFDDDRDLLPPE
jgi:hypothetical protein|tara:strand:+ start:280 stop:603 length:324 start_codon:yes stop_codon:yes gene_type:complete